MENVKFVFTGLLLGEEHGYTALCTELDVASQGETSEEARRNLEEAVTLYLETAIENNLPFIRPVPEQENPLVTRKKDVAEVFRLAVELGLQVHA
jgi:predicted RNase H-like HicB family nuclease